MTEENYQTPMNNKDEILDRLDAAGYPENEFALQYDEFFADIEDPEVIGVNIPYNKPTTQEFYQVFQLIAEYPEVEDIYVRIADADYPQDWFYSDAVYIIGNMSEDLVRKLTENLYPDEISTGWMYGFPANLEKKLEKKRVISLWWD